MREEVYPHDATIVPAQLAWCPTSASHLLAAHAQRRRALVECWPLAKGRANLASTQSQATAAAYALLHPKPTDTSKPTTAPKPTNTPKPPTATVPQKSNSTPTIPLVTGATLGGPDSAFQTKYGHAADDLWDINGVTFSTNLDTGADGQQHVFEMLVYKSDATTWTQVEAQPICTAFLPPDATHQRDTQDSRGNLEQVYMSALLAVTFPPASSVSYDPMAP